MDRSSEISIVMLTHTLDKIGEPVSTEVHIMDKGETLVLDCIDFINKHDPKINMISTKFIDQETLKKLTPEQKDMVEKKRMMEEVMYS